MAKPTVAARVRAACERAVPPKYDDLRALLDFAERAARLYVDYQQYEETHPDEPGPSGSWQLQVMELVATARHLGLLTGETDGE